MKWENYTIEQIKNGKDGEGNRLASLFSREYVETMGASPCLNCPGLQSRVSEFIKRKSNPMKELKNSGFVLKPMYEGLSLVFGSRKTISKANLTDELAAEFIKKHPKGVDIFDRVPKGFDANNVTLESEGQEKEVADMNVKELKVKAESLGLAKSGTKDELIERINEKLSETEEVETVETDEIENEGSEDSEVEDETIESEGQKKE